MGTSKGNYVGGKWIKEKEALEIFESISPIDESVLWQGEKAANNTINLCVEVANEAQKNWMNMDFDTRSSYLRKYVQLVEDNRDELARRIMIEVGKPQWEANAEVNSVIGKLNPSIEAFKQRNATIVRAQGQGKSVTRFRPHGVVGVVGPYNFPAHMPNGHIITALLAGNTVIIKPSEKVPYTSEFIMEIWDKVGLPDGVINMLQGDSAVGERLCLSKGVHAILFTGSRNVGEHIDKLCAGEKICALEMGGNSPLIVWDTTNMDAAVLATIQSSFITSGQRCSSARRVIIPDNSFGEHFVTKLVKATQRIVVDRPDSVHQPFLGPMKDKKFVDILLQKQRELVELGGEILVECKRKENLGPAYVTPGIIDMTNAKREFDEEIIGPFIQLKRVRSFDEALDEANNTKYGLAAGVFTEDEQLYKKFAQNIKAGLINWNQQLTGASGWAPFGGIKASGNCRPSGYLATDYCVYSTASLEFEQIVMPDKLPCGIILGDD